MLPVALQAPIEYRLEGGRSGSEGRLEVKYRGTWGSVCDDDFNQRTAQVACNSMGYYGEAVSDLLLPGCILSSFSLVPHRK